MTRRASSRGRPRPVPERVAWHDGAALRRGDLAAAVAHEERLLALHVAAAHDTWGVALGLALVRSDDGRRVLVGPGLAYTCRGDALVLAGATPAPPFPAAAAADLVIAAPRVPDASPCERSPSCDGATRRERPALRWEPAAVAFAATSAPVLAPGVRLGEDVPLGRFAVGPDGLLDGPDHATRRAARALARPHLWLGVEAPGALAWEPTSGDVTASVDTSAAGFSAVPRYAAWLVSDVAWPPGVIGPFVSVAAAGRRRLRVRLVLGGTAPAGAPIGLLREGATMSTLCWLGIEDARGCPPSFLSSSHAAAVGWAAALAALHPLPGSDP